MFVHERSWSALVFKRINMSALSRILVGTLSAIFLCTAATGFFSCRTKVNVSFGEGKAVRQGLKESRPKAEKLFEQIADGSAIHEFSPKYFNTDTTLSLLSSLRRKCDLLNREGGFVGDMQGKTKNAHPVNTLVYEYRLKCDSLRFILTYKLEPPVELVGFKVEGIEKKNAIVQQIMARRKKD